MSERYVASRGGLLELVPSSRRPSQPPTDEPPASVTKDQDHMAAKKKRKLYTPEEKAEILARAEASSAAEVSRESGISEGTISFWRKKAKGTAKARPATKVAKRAPVETNGHADPPASDELPTLQLKGLRQWVSRAVRDELAPVRRQLQGLVDAMGKAP